MKKTFESFKVFEGLMKPEKFENFQIESGECEEPIFSKYPDSKFVVILKSGSCYVYSSDNNRVKYDDIEKLSEVEGDVSDKSILGTPNGDFIKDQYHELSKLTVVDVLQFPNKDFKKSKSKYAKKQDVKRQEPQHVQDDEPYDDEEEERGYW